MSRFTSRQLAATTVLSVCGAVTAVIAADQAQPPAPPAQSQQLIAVKVPSAPPKEYVMPKKGISDAIRKAVQNPARKKEDVARDAYRKPAELMAMAGVKPGSKILEFGSFGELDTYGQYYTTLLAEVVGPKGMVYMFDSKDIDEQFGGNSRAFAAAHPNTKYQAVDYNKIEIPKNIDIVWSVLNYHELLMRGTEMTAFHDKLFKAMRPGAIYLIVDHAGVIGADMKVTLPMHRLDPSIIRSGVGAAGFEMVLESRLLERTDDDHKWNIYTEGKADQSDLTVYMYRKPVVY
jgi:predicted methyltransferase